MKAIRNTPPAWARPKFCPGVDLNLYDLSLTTVNYEGGPDLERFPGENGSNLIAGLKKVQAPVCGS